MTAGLFSKSGQMQVGPFGGWRFRSIAKYGAAVCLLGLFVTEWKAVTRNIPLYNSKYESVDYNFLREQDKLWEQAAEEAREKAAEKAAAAAAAKA